MCGENFDQPLELNGWQGSSPRVRGKPLVVEVAEDGDGLIPACAGKTGTGTGPFDHHMAHPRVCGENGRGR